MCTDRFGVAWLVNVNSAHGAPETRQD